MAGSIVSDTAYRVTENTSERINLRIRRNTIQKIEEVGQDRGLIDARLKQLDQEWDIERAIQANASTILLAGLALGVAVDKRWFYLPAVVGTFLLQHAVQGWCPPVPVLRRLGFRTQREIDNERMILLARKGAIQGFKDIPAGQALAAIE